MRLPEIDCLVLFWNSPTIKIKVVFIKWNKRLTDFLAVKHCERRWALCLKSGFCWCSCTKRKTRSANENLQQSTGRKQLVNWLTHKKSKAGMPRSVPSKRLAILLRDRSLKKRRKQHFIRYYFSKISFSLKLKMAKYLGILVQRLKVMACSMRHVIMLWYYIRWWTILWCWKLWL